MTRSLPILCRRSLVACLFLHFSMSLSAQCPERNSLLHRIIYLRDSLKPPPSVQLKELLGTSAVMEKCRYTDDSVYAFLLRRIGVLYFQQGQNGDYARSVRYTRSAINVLHRKNNREDCRRLLAKCYYNLLIYYDSLGLVNERNNALDSFLVIAIPVSPDIDVLNRLNQRVDDLLNAGDFYRCIQYADMAAMIPLKDSGQAGILYQDIITNKLNALLFLQQYDECDEALGKVQREFLRIGKYRSQATFYSLKGHIAEGKGAAASSLDYFEKAFVINVRDKFNAGCTQSLNDIGFLYLSYLRSPRKALPYFRAALQYSTPFESVNIYNNIASAHIQEQQYDSAFFYFQKGLDQLRPGLQERDLLSIPLAGTANMMTYIIELLLNKGDALLKEGNEKKDSNLVRQAINLYKTTDKLLERIRSEQAEMGSQLFWRANNHRLYDRAIKAAFSSGSAEDAFYFFEKSRAVLLNDQLRDLHQSNSDDVLKQAQTQRTVHALEKELANTPPGSPHYNDVRDQLFSFRQQLTSILQDIRTRNRQGYSGQEDSTPVNIREVQTKVLSGGQALMELFAGDSSIYVITLTTVGSRLSQIAPGTFDSVVHLYMAGLTDAAQLNSRFGEFTAASRRLFHLIFADDTSLPTRIIISPDGTYFPFEALVTNKEGLSPHYLVEDHAVSYTYSARYLLNDFQVASPGTTRSFLGVAPVRYAEYLHLPPLTASDRSLRQLRSNFRDGDELTYSQATLRNFQQDFPKYRILQLYTHATSTSADGYPLIYFADSALSLPDLLSDNKPVTGLVVLSACETGSGSVYKGEGVFSFNRGFAALGIPACVTNLWAVDDLSTYRLTELFYKYLSGGDATDIALQKAKKDFLQQASRQQRLPYYWAASVLVGKAAIFDQGSSPKQVNYIMRGFAIFFILLLFYLAARWRRG